VTAKKQRKYLLIVWLSLSEAQNTHFQHHRQRTAPFLPRKRKKSTCKPNSQRSPRLLNASMLVSLFISLWWLISTLEGSHTNKIMCYKVISFDHKTHFRAFSRRSLTYSSGFHCSREINTHVSKVVVKKLHTTPTGRSWILQLFKNNDL